MRKFICTQDCHWAGRYWGQDDPCNIADPGITPPEHCFESLEGAVPVKPRDDTAPKVVVKSSPARAAGVVTTDVNGEPKAKLDESEEGDTVSEQAERQRVNEVTAGAPSSAAFLEG